MKEYKAYIFDFDGTLMESMGALILMYKHGFESINYPFKDEDAYLYMHETLHRTFERLNLDSDKYLTFISSFDDFKNDDEVINANVPFPDALKLIDNLLNNNKKIAILTGNDSNYCQKVLNRLGLPHFYLTVVGFNDVTNTKPDPEGIYLCLDRLGIDKKDVCYIGDSLNDMLAAFNAGIDGILIDRKNQYENGNYLHIDDLTKLIINH